MAATSHTTGNPQAPHPAVPPRRVLVVGGTGVFGSRLVAALRRTTALEILVASRTPRPGMPAIDTGSVTAQQLRDTGAFLVVDAAGPFQGTPPRLARAAIAAGLHYVDLADARDFIAGFPALDAAARAAGLVALTGASSTPALSGAALDSLTAGWRAVHGVDIAIAPGNRAPRGLSVIRAILGQAGHPVRVFAGGAWTTRPGWGMTIHRAMPGLGRRWLGLCETADLDLVPTRLAVRDAVLFRAGLELPVLHLGLLAASAAVRLGLVRSLAPLARPARAFANLLLRYGTDRGGMTVAACGLDAAGLPVHAVWSLVAEAGDGPQIPTLPALAAVRAIANGRIATPGARPCVGLLSLADIAAEFAPYRIAATTSIRPAGVFPAVLGAAFAHLPAPLRRLHLPGDGLVARGRADIEGAQGWLARLVAAAFGLPRAAAAVTVVVRIAPDAGGETWERDFAGRPFSSRLAIGTDGRLTERFGPFTFTLDLPTDARGITGMPVRGWRLGPLPLPLWLAPRSIASETVDAEGRFRFDVALHLPLRLGRLCRYRGWLVPDDAV